MSRERRLPKPTEAERLRRHRAAFELALQMRCTPADALKELERREARAKWEASNARLQARMNGHPPPAPPPPVAPQPCCNPPPWMLFD